MRKIKIIKANQARVIPAPRSAEPVKIPVSEIRNSWLNETRRALADRRANDIQAFFGNTQTA